MGSAKNTGSAERKARIEELRRAERAREHRNRILTIAGAVVVVAGLVVGGVVLVDSQSGSKATAASDAKGAGHFVTGADGVRTWQGTLGRTHTTKTVKYPMEPPVGGDHNPVWQNCNGDVYTKPVDNMNAVHSLEHGAVWVTYNGKASKADVDALAAKVRKTPYTLMSPVEDQKDPIMLSAWAHQRTVKSASDPNVDTFLSRFVQGSQTPEQGAACTGGLGR
ncbi:DUF3105 domain-containing protein [Streptomyces sp. TP-A0356]|uniref:DUF3105 domain-containing protein n=1 Tax=Streptomyces sp. TP-A0356 TaxID=1359208 RepID=UPI0006E1F54F|nr:DUF3105 domain-containing protein [Streptomyces sp. TP-A0356]